MFVKIYNFSSIHVDKNRDIMASVIQDASLGWCLSLWLVIISVSRQQEHLKIVGLWNFWLIGS